MTKARDLAGFASSSVTTTASDGLVLKGDGSSTDVVIKNGANATVATVADGTTTLAATANLTAGGTITATGASVGALARGAIQVGNSSGVAAPLTIGSNTQLLQSNGTTAAWATVSTGFEAIVFPSNWASPTTTFSSSGTYSKGSLSDDAFVWVYLIGGGGGGSRSDNSNIYEGGVGGRAMLIYAKAGILNGGSYVVGAGAAGRTSAGTTQSTNPTASSFTLTSGNGGNAFATSAGISPSSASSDLGPFMKTVLISSSDTLASGLSITGTEITGVTFSGVIPSGFSSFFAGANSRGSNPVVFGAGNGAGKRFSAAIGSHSDVPRCDSLFAGNGGASTSGATGVAPGGGGTVGFNANGGAGAAGLVRVYNV